MLGDFIGADHVYLVCGYTDLRLGLDGLIALIDGKYKLNPLSNSLFLFCGRRLDRIKGLYREEDGFVLVYKRLDCGRFQWPRNSSEALALTAQQYRWLMEGLQIVQPTAHRPLGAELKLR